LVFFSPVPSFVFVCPKNPARPLVPAGRAVEGGRFFFTCFVCSFFSFLPAFDGARFCRGLPQEEPFGRFLPLATPAVAAIDGWHKMTAVARVNPSFKLGTPNFFSSVSPLCFLLYYPLFFLARNPPHNVRKNAQPLSLFLTYTSLRPTPLSKNLPRNLKTPLPSRTPPIFDPGTFHVDAFFPLLFPPNPQPKRKVRTVFPQRLEFFSPSLLSFFFWCRAPTFKWSHDRRVSLPPRP